MKNNKNMKAVDFYLLISIIILLITGTIMVFSASWPEAIIKKGDQYFFLKRHLIWIIASLISLIVSMNFHYKNYQKFSFLIFIFGLLSVAALKTPLGIQIKGSRRWLNIGGFTVMPADILKLCSVIFFANFLSVKKEDTNTLLQGTIPTGIIIVLSIIFIFKEDLGTTVSIIGILGTMYFVGGANILHSMSLLIIGVIFIYQVMIKKGGFRANRLKAFLDPFKYKQDIGWQVVQSLYAIGSGGFSGVGLGKSRQKFFYLSEAYNDFIFSIIAEELGFVGACGIIFMYILLAYRGYKIAMNSKDLYARYLAVGLTSFVIVQALIHFGVVTSSIPTTGITLPLISYGGTSLVITTFAMGILLNISRYADLND